MSSVTPTFVVGAEVLGYVGVVATWRRPVGGLRRDPMLVIQSCADTVNGVYTPAQSVTISGRDGLLALRKAIDEALKEQSND